MTRDQYVTLAAFTQVILDLKRGQDEACAMRYRLQEKWAHRFFGGPPPPEVPPEPSPDGDSPA